MDQLAISAEPFIEKCRSLVRAKNVCMNVADGRVRLGWRGVSEEGFMDRVEMITLGISYKMLFDALSEARGANSMIERYPINDIIRHRLTKLSEPIP